MSEWTVRRRKSRRRGNWRWSTQTHRQHSSLWRIFWPAAAAVVEVTRTLEGTTSSRLTLECLINDCDCVYRLSWPRSWRRRRVNRECPAVSWTVFPVLLSIIIILFSFIIIFFFSPFHPFIYVHHEFAFWPITTTATAATVSATEEEESVQPKKVLFSVMFSVSVYSLNGSYWRRLQSVIIQWRQQRAY